MFSYLKKAYYYDYHPYNQLRQAVSFGLFVFLFLWFFAPFGLQSMPSGLVKTCLIFGSITTATMILLNVLIPPLAPGFFHAEKWTVGRQLLYTLLNVGLIGLGNYAYFSLAFSGDFSWSGVIWFQLVTIGISIFPIGFMIMRKEARDSLRYSRESSAIDTEIRKHLGEAHGHSLKELVVLSSQNGQDQISCPADELLAIEASDNYILLHLLEKGKITRQMLRQTLQEAEKVLTDLSQFFRCHRSYLVNLDKVTGMHGNAQGYKLELEGMEKDIPVSRKLNDTIRQKLTIHP